MISRNFGQNAFLAAPNAARQRFVVAHDRPDPTSALLPATLRLFGRANWWFPKRLDRLLPNLMPEDDQETPLASTGVRPSTTAAVRYSLPGGGVVTAGVGCPYRVAMSAQADSRAAVRGVFAHPAVSHNGA
jgi:hypothetical protein